MSRRFILPTTSLLATAALALAACGDDGENAHDHDHDHDTGPVSDVVAPDGGGDASDDPDTAGPSHDAVDDSGDNGEGKPDTTGGSGVQTDPAAVATETLADGTRRTRLDAEDGTLWTHFAFATGALANPDAGDGWDLAMQRYLIKLGPGVEAAVLDGADFATVVAPADGYGVDLEGASMSADFAMGQWYDYDVVHHTLSPRPGRVYVVKLPSGERFKVALRDYYDDAGSSGLVTFDWGAIAPPVVAPVEDLTVAAGATTYLDLAAAREVTAADAWDLAVLQGIAFATASGTTSPAGHGGAKLVDTAYDAITASDTVGFVVDAEGPLSPQPGSPVASHNAAFATWYDDDRETHVITPRDVRFIVRGRDGDYYKLAVVRAGATSLGLNVAPVVRVPEDHTLALGPAEAFVDLARGAIVTLPEGASAAESTAWDLALAGVSLRTNGGTSGPGQGGARLLGEDAFASYAALAGELTVDTMLPIAGPPGAGDESRNAVLDAWYRYSGPPDHSLSATGNVFVVALADGSRARAAVTGYAAGVVTLTYTYAGPGHDAL